MNGAYAAARGETVASLAGRNFWHFIPDVDRPAVRAMLDRLTPESPEVRIENRFETADGVRWTLWTNRALSFDEAGRWLEAQSAGIDITDRKRAEEALREADRRKDEFIATLAHELRNPLVPVRNALEVMKLARNDSAVVEQARAMMERQLTQMIRLIDDLLDLSRVSQGKIVLRRERLSLATVEAHSEGRGKGSEFVVRLPIATTRRSHPEGESNGRTRLAGGRVLVVDDNRDAAVSLAMMLHLLGCDARTAHDGVEALGMAEAFRPDLILLDIGLPRLNGYDVARKLREQPWGRGMALVAITGWGGEGDQRRSREAGFDAHLVKPVAPAALEQVLLRLQPVA